MRNNLKSERFTKMNMYFNLSTVEPRGLVRLRNKQTVDLSGWQTIS